MNAGEETTPPRFRLIPFEDVQLDESPPYLVKDIIPRDALTVIWGPSGSPRAGVPRPSDRKSRFLRASRR